MRGPVHFLAYFLAPILALTFLSGGSAMSAGTAPAPPEPAIPKIDPEAVELLDASATFLASQQSLSLTSETSYEVLQRSGQMIEFGSIRKAKLKRPNKLRIITEDREGEQSGAIYNGQEFSIFDIDENVYATVSHTGDIDDAFEYITEELDTPIPLADFLYNDPLKVWKENLTAASYVADETLNGTPCAHLAFRNDVVDYQIWIGLGDKPLPYRLVIHYKQHRGMPQFRAELRDWKLSPKLNDKDFVFKPAEGAERIPFATHTPQADEEAGK